MPLGLFILLVVAVVLLFVILTVVATYIMAHPPRLTEGIALARDMVIDPQQVVDGFESLKVMADDNTPIEVWALAGESADGPCLIGLHGWGDSKYGLLNHAPLLLPLCSQFVIYDQRGHGDSLHRASTGGGAEANDLRRVIDAVRGSGINQPIVLLGHSMGGVLAIKQASDLQVAGVIADSPFNDPVDVLKRMLRSIRVTTWPLVPLMLGWMRLRGRPWSSVLTTDAAATLRCPLLVIHGEADVLVPLDDGRLIAETAPCGSFFVAPGAGHLEASAADPVGYQRAIAAWLG